MPQIAIYVRKEQHDKWMKTKREQKEEIVKKLQKLIQKNIK